MKRCLVIGVAAVALVILSAGPAMPQSKTPWIHVRVEEQGAKATKVHVNLPLSVVQVALELAPDKVVSDGHFHLNHGHHGDLSVEEMRRLWTELRDSGEAEWVSVKEEDHTVSVARRGNFLRIQVDETEDEGKEQVDVEIPLAVVDALFSGNGNELDIASALQELSKLRGDIVRVNEDDTSVRIWIDERD